MDAKLKKAKPKLDRRNAIKNIDYVASPSTSSRSSSFDDQSPSIHRTQSVDPFFDSQSSFRIQGVGAGEFELIFRSLGLSGPEDFDIPAAAWEASKARHLLDTQERAKSPEKQLLTDFEARVRIDGATKREIENSEAKNGSNLVEFASRVGVINHPVAGGLRKDNSSGKFEARFRFDNENTRSECSQLLSSSNSVSVEAGRAGGAVGIKGDRPPLLAPPPVMLRQSHVDNVSSTWDIMKSFAPEDDADLNSPEHLDMKAIEEDDYNEDGYVDDKSQASVLIVEQVYSISPNGKLRRPIISWQKGGLLGSGSFGTVYEGFTDDGFFFAVKEVSLLDQGKQGKQSIFQLEQEISLLNQFEHENIVQYLGTDKDDGKLYIFLELVTKGSLASLYQKYHLRDSQVSAYTRQILNGLKYLHERNVVHRDIKCANILVDASGSVKLADFGLAKATKLNDVKSSKGTPFWMAPEVVNMRNQGYGLPADIWSLGCTVLEMLTRQPPYSQLEGMQALFRIGKGELPPVPNSLSRDARDFILRCLQVNPNDRPTAAQLLDHPFLKRSLRAPPNPASPHNSIER